MKSLVITSSITNRTATIEAYLRAISKIEPFKDYEEEYACAMRMVAGDESAREELVKRNLRFAVSVAKSYESAECGLDDLINEANIGMVQATYRFDPTRGFKFISFAVFNMRKNCIAYCAEHGKGVALPNNRIKEINLIKKLARQLEQKNEGFIDPYELAKLSDGVLSADKVDYLIGLSQMGIDSFDAPMGGDDNGTMHDYFADRFEAIENGEDRAIRVNSKNIVDEAISSLSYEEQLTLTHSFGLDGGTKLTLEEIGNKLGLSREGVRQMKFRALNKVKISLTKMGLSAKEFGL